MSNSHADDATGLSTPSPELEVMREQVVRSLTDRYADDSIPLDDFERRLDAMHAARSTTELAAMARELDALTPTMTAVPFAAPDRAPLAPRRDGSSPTVPTTPYSGAGYGVADGRVEPHQHMRVIMSATRREPRGPVPALVEVTAVMGEFVLDLCDVDWTRDCEVDVTALMSNVRIIVPLEIDVRMEVSAFMGAANDRLPRRMREARVQAPTYGPRPRLRVTGRAIMAEVTVRRE